MNRLGRVMDRDKNASFNQHLIMRKTLRGKPRPAVFKRNNVEHPDLGGVPADAIEVAA